MKDSGAILDQLNVVGIDMIEAKLNFIAGGWIAGEIIAKRNIPKGLFSLVLEGLSKAVTEFYTSVKTAYICAGKPV